MEELFPLPLLPLFPLMRKPHFGNFQIHIFILHCRSAICCRRLLPVYSIHPPRGPCYKETKATALLSRLRASWSWARLESGFRVENFQVTLDAGPVSFHGQGDRQVVCRNSLGKRLRSPFFPGKSHQGVFNLLQGD